MNEADEAADVITALEGAVGRITLNRPKSINALTTTMLRDIQLALKIWEKDLSVSFVLIDGAGERGLCAGGDIRMIWESARSDGTAAREFFRTEYAVNAHVSAYRKPFVALMDGLVMGGGVGVSSHGDVRVVTERTVIAMPEVTIGFVPDVGGTYLLSRAPGLVGTHVALTASTLSPGDAIWMGLADHYVPSERLPDLIRALLRVTDPVIAIATFAEPPPASVLQAQQGWIDACYEFSSAQEIVAALRDNSELSAGEAADAILVRSPTAVSVTLEALRRARHLPTLPDVLEQEYRVSCACLESHDLVEGIRAQVIDKDRAPHWVPSDLASVGMDMVAAFFDAPVYGSIAEPSGIEGVTT